MAQKQYYAIAPNLRIKIEAGKKSLNPQTGYLEQGRTISVTLKHPQYASIGHTLDEICVKAEKQNGDIKLTKEQRELLSKRLDFLTERNYIANSRGDFMAKVKGPESAAESYKVDSLSRQIDEHKDKLNDQAKMISDKDSEIERLKEQLNKRKV